MAESRGSYERRAPSLPRRYAVTPDGRVRLGRPVADALDVDPGEEVEVRRNDRGEIVLEAADDGGER
ncbi:bifunctional DNA-binding transcriptional regulator/antitoxin component of YhaV-PrlF toxin-antitoxin module [Halarchaeum solikamskense]|uniref:AbrB/MazE/SpoVT family DNA-binding domain-containing protein n=1 Tax=Halarchaeum nitratireducens TaxID=489913 RepID=UPI001B3AFFAF|nr:hypothetical protein [Halarchaeum solikamskense]MBP2251633.1 bifunctional DNA-binding transcriptional regulator/antitoxin component of YhaV-PrlF toxin-antitoxin module [Halarchaeum solikamskense]